MSNLIILLSLFLLSSFEHISAQTQLIIHKINGEVVSFMLDSKPRVTFLDNKVFLQSEAYELYFYHDQVEKFTFSDNSTNIDVFESYKNVDKGTKIYTTNGVLLKQYDYPITDLHVAINELPSGIYVIIQPTNKYKIVK